MFHEILYVNIYYYHVCFAYNRSVKAVLISRPLKLFQSSLATFFLWRVLWTICIVVVWCWCSLSNLFVCVQVATHQLGTTRVILRSISQRTTSRCVWSRCSTRSGSAADRLSSTLRTLVSIRCHIFKYTHTYYAHTHVAQTCRLLRALRCQI